jgi:hypothetical protein
MINPTLDLLKDIKGQKVLITQDFQAVKKGSKIIFLNHQIQEENIILNFAQSKREFQHTLKWHEELPFTQFVSAKDAYWYAKRTKKRFRQEIENVIFQNSPKLLFLYALAFIKSEDDFSEDLKKIILKSPYYSYKYAKNYLDRRLTPEQEMIFLKDKTGESLASYALYIVKEKLPDVLHNFLTLKFMDKSTPRFVFALIQNYFHAYSPDEKIERLPESKFQSYNNNNNNNNNIYYYHKAFNKNYPQTQTFNANKLYNNFKKK